MALTPLHRPKGRGNSNGACAKTQLHSITPGKSGHPVKGKGTKLGGKAY